VQRIFKCGDIQNITLLRKRTEHFNRLCETPFYVIIYRSHKLFKMVQFLAHPVVIGYCIYTAHGQ